MHQLADAHCHLQDERLAPDRNAVLARARNTGVACMVCNGSEQADWAAVSELAAANPDVLPAFGLHPWYIARRTPEWQDELLAALLRAPPSSVGEIGLDHARKDVDRADQRLVFETQLALAAALGRPASVHCRHAWEALLAALDNAPLPDCGFLVHSYSGSADMIRPLVERGAYISFSGSITHSANRRGRLAARAVPLDRLLVETDSPDIPPAIPTDPAKTNSWRQGEPNEPANLVHVLRALAELRDMPANLLAAHLWQNAQRLFVARETPA